MSIFKCKMCGGTLEINGETVVTCDYCGTTQTLPKKSDEVTENLFNRANNLRLKSEFDKAEQVYEKILEIDNGEAEAHWGIVLCKYGIEYVEDPKTFKRIPTCHRTSYEAITANADYLAAIENADQVQRSVYEEEARAIDNIQKNILNIVKNEDPFDVFICYKETDSAGKRTVDSAIANDIYHQLTQEGFKTFYAAITLESKLGQEYEPYIFSALNSAKVMLVLGTKPEYFDAVWVKNEWSRYLKLMVEDRSRLLIPCYRDMDAYDLPEEFAHFQAQDMGKIGFINDVVRGIKKVVSTTSAPAQAPVNHGTPTGSNTNTAPLLERAFMFLEDGEWASADEYCEKVLDIDPKCAEAYLGKLMAELHVRSKENLQNCAQPFDASNNYQKAHRFGNEELNKELVGYVRYINERNENERLEGIYSQAVNSMSSAKTEGDYKAVAQKLNSISHYKDSQKLVEECLEKAEIARKDAVLSEAREKIARNRIETLEVSVKLLEKIKGWKNADEMLENAKKKLAEMKAAEEKACKEAKKRAKRNEIIFFVVIVLIAVVVLLFKVIIPNGKYNDAIALMEAGKYSEAISAFDALDGYKDSASKITECILDEKYNDAITLMEAGKYSEAISAFEALEGHKDSSAKIIECNTAILDEKYNGAITLMDAGNIIEAYESLIALDGYKDSVNKADSIYDKYKVEKLKAAKVGDYVFFGAYEQDNNTSNGKEDVEWLVLEIKNGKALVISKYALDCKTYTIGDTAATWETCTLRKWLNNVFINAAFSADEKAMIPTVTVSADKNPDYSTNPGNATQDQVFLLSIQEANKYFSSNSARQCKPTDEVANGMYFSSYYGNCWWLRSPGNAPDCAAYVSRDGDVDEYGSGVAYYYKPVRPALWIDLNS